MLRKCLFISAALLLCLATSASARIYWSDSGTDHLWSNANNWHDYTDPDPNFPEGTLAPLGREPNSTDWVAIGKGNRGMNYPPQLASIWTTLTDPTIDSADANCAELYCGGSVVNINDTSGDPNVNHFLTITSTGRLWVQDTREIGASSNMAMAMGEGGYMTVYNYGELIAGSAGGGRIYNTKRGGNGVIESYGDSFIGVNVEYVSCDPGDAEMGQSGDVLLSGNAEMNIKRWVNDGRGKIDISDNAKLVVRQASSANKGYDQTVRWLAEGLITVYGGWLDDEIITGTVPLVRAQVIATLEPNDPCDRANSYGLSGAADPSMAYTAAQIDAYLAYDPIPPDGAGTAGTPLSVLTGLKWTPGYDVAAVASQLFYYDANDGEGLVLKATLDADVNSIDPYVLGYGLSGENSYWRVDEVNSVGGTTVGDVWSYRADAGPATNLAPADDPATEDVDESQNLYPEQTLTWDAGFLSNASKVYRSTVSWDDVNDRTAPMVYEGTDTWYATGELTLDETYYWCVDAVGATTILGTPISFSTAPTILIDDFDDYAIDAELRAVWSSGTYGNNESVISVSTTTAIDDGNSMMLTYVCYGKYGETTAAMSYRDDAYSISAWVYGAATNALAPVYMGAAVGATVDVQVIAGVDVQVEEWQECRVAFGDLALTSADIDTVIIGVGDRANPGNEGVGSIYVDEVRLYPRRCLAPDVIPADFDADCLVGFDDVDILAQRWLVAKTAPTEPTADLELYLPFDEGEGNTVAHDFSGRGFDMPASGAIIWEPTGGVPGYGGAVRSGGGDARFVLFDDWHTNGDIDTVKQIFAPIIANNSNLTVMFYMKYAEGLVVGRNFILGSQMWDPISETVKANPLTFRDTSGGGGFACWMGLEYDHRDEIGTYGWEHIFDPTFREYLGPGYDVADEIKGIWYHFAMVKDADNGIGRIYEDGVQIAQFDDAILDVNSMSMSIDNIFSFGVLGCSASGWGSPDNTSLDEFRIYSEALNEAEIRYVLGEEDEFFPNSAGPMNLYNADDIINFKDYSDFANVWLDDQLWPALP